ncbi:aminoglycoside phosphotransferase family protein [Amycolatopsis sp. YIM 10]|uniref:aminoglycoside phosphotransferase family protein n=1 Tax=Amycolatopsis sp. YIM 10 TaxID=2653857 RepID=UPI00128FD5B4|nr:aminoglycoside phosphotransferase family protein [Amycolatopsis sp. YIM 10]QFU89130.1 Aminoglycoside/hydroxyurea antibiotic resistance kinase [Amycolatopsis sp. YIM 10]
MSTVPAGLLASGAWQRAGPAGRHWVEGLPGTFERLRARWSLTPDGPALHGFHSMVQPVRRGGEPLVLKASWPDEDIDSEARALSIWDGRDAVRLLDAEPGDHALLLERAHAVRSIRSVRVEDALPLLGGLLRRMAVPAPDGLRRVSAVAAEIQDTLTSRWEAAGRPFPPSLAARVEHLAGELSTLDDPYLVNRELSYGKVLAADREPWLVISPRAVAGQLEYQVAPLLWTRLDEIGGRTAVLRQFRRLAVAAGLDRDLARSWTVVRSAEHLLTGLAAGYTEEPVRCRLLLDTFSGTH